MLPDVHCSIFLKHLSFIFEGTGRYFGKFAYVLFCQVLQDEKMDITLMLLNVKLALEDR